MTFGTASAVRGHGFSAPAAGKTGTVARCVVRGLLVELAVHHLGGQRRLHRHLDGLTTLQGATPLRRSGRSS